MRCLVLLLAATLLALAHASPGAAGPQNAGYAVRARLTPGGEGGWDLLAIDPAAHRLYVARATRVQVLDARTGRLVGEIQDTPGAHGVALAPGLGRGYASSGRDSSVTVFD